VKQIDGILFTQLAEPEETDILTFDSVLNTFASTVVRAAEQPVPPFLCQTVLCSCPVVNREVSGCYSGSLEACPAIILSPPRQMWSVFNVYHSTKNCSAVQVEFMQAVYLFIIQIYTLHCAVLMSVSSGKCVHFYYSPFCDWRHDMLQDTVASTLSFLCETT